MCLVAISPIPSTLPPPGQRKHIHLSARRTDAMRRARPSGTGQVVRETRVASRSWSAPSITPGPHLPSMVLIMTSVISAYTLCNAALERSSPWQRIPWTWRHWNHVWQGIKPRPHARPKCAEHVPNQTSWAWKYLPWHHQRLGPRHDHPIDHARSRQRPCQWWHCGGRKPGSTAATPFGMSEWSHFRIERNHIVPGLIEDGQRLKCTSWVDQTRRHRRTSLLLSCGHVVWANILQLPGCNCPRSGGEHQVSIARCSHDITMQILQSKLAGFSLDPLANTRRQAIALIGPVAHWRRIAHLRNQLFSRSPWPASGPLESGAWLFSSNPLVDA